MARRVLIWWQEWPVGAPSRGRRPSRQASIWGVAGALAASPVASPSSAPGQVVLKLGWTSEPDNLNVFVGYEATCWEIWALNYDYLFGSGTHNQPTLDLANVFPSSRTAASRPTARSGRSTSVAA